MEAGNCFSAATEKKVGIVLAKCSAKCLLSTLKFPSARETGFPTMRLIRVERFLKECAMLVFSRSPEGTG